MAVKLSKDQQWKTVVQGLALGCLSMGESDLSADKMSAEFAFAHAWRRWSRSNAFASVSSRDFYVYTSKSTRRIGATAAWEWRRGSFVPFLTIEGWGVEESLQSFVEESPVSAEDWRDLARLFLGRLV